MINLIKKQDFYQSAFVSILLYRCTTWMLTKCQEEKLDGNCTRMLWAILKKSWKQHPTKQQLFGHLPSITKTIQVRQTDRWRSKEKLISDVLLLAPRHGRNSVGCPARIYLHQLCADTRCSLENLLEAMDEREREKEKERERVREIRASSTTRWRHF